MALENADGGGDFIDNDQLQAMCEEKALVVCKILRIEPGSRPTPTSRSDWFPVVVDMLVLSGRWKGTVYRSERMTKAGFTNTLREKFDPRDAELKAKERRKIARTEGTDLAARFGFYTADGVKRFCLNAARAGDMAEIEALFEQTGNDPYTAAEKAELDRSSDVLFGETDGEIGAKAVVPAAAGAYDDDEPPF